MAKNKAENQGKTARQEGNSRSSNPHQNHKKLWYTESDRRKKDDWNKGYDDEDNRRKKK